MGEAVQLRCQWCSLCKTATSVLVDSRGVENPDYFFIGEAPGPDEDQQALPFVGLAGQKLVEMIEKAGLDLNKCRFGNIVRCIPRDVANGPFRAPKPSEVEACSSHLFRDILEHKPNIIIPVGRPAFMALTGQKTAITKARGRLYNSNGLFKPEWLAYDYDLWRFHNHTVDAVLQPTFAPGSEEWHSQKLVAEQSLGYEPPYFTMIPIVHPSFINRGATEYEELTIQDMGLIERVARGDSWFSDKDYELINSEEELTAYFQEIKEAYRSGECDRIAVDLETTQAPDQDSIHLLPYFPDSRILAVAISHKPNHGRVILAQHKDSAFNNPIGIQVLRGELEYLLAEVPVVNHNIIFDANMLLAKWGIKIAKVHGDTMLMHHLCFPKMYPHGLDFIGGQYLGTGGHKAEMDGALEALPPESRSMEFVGLDILNKYAAGDADVTRQLSYILEQEMSKLGVDQAYESVYRQNGAWELIREMMYQGFQIDQDYLAKMQEEWPKQIDQIFQALHQHSPYIQKFYELRVWERHNQPIADAWIKKKYNMVDKALDSYKLQSSQNYYTLVQQALAAEPDRYMTADQWKNSTRKDQGTISLGSWHQLQDLWYKVMRVPYNHLTRKQQKGGRGLPSTGKDIRKALIDRCKQERLEHEAWVIEQCGEWTKLSKLNGSFIQPLSRQIPLKAGDEIDPLVVSIHRLPEPGKVHSSYLMHGTNTGRLSCAGPNLQQTPPGPFRQCFISRWRGSGGIIIASDYSQIEVRIMAIEANDEGLIRVLNEGRDVHTYTASLINGIPEEHVTKELRTPAKGVTFGIIYGQTARGLAGVLGCSEREAEAIQFKLLEVIPALSHYIQQQHAFLREYGYVTTRLGRRRVIPEIRSKKEELVAYAERCSVNMPIQSLASDLMLMAMGRINRRSSDEGTFLVPINVIHDAGMFDTPPGRLLSGMRLIREEMVVKPQQLHDWLIVVPKAEFEIGAGWGHMMEATLLDDGQYGDNPLRSSKIELLGKPEDYPLLVSEIRAGSYQVQELEYTLHPNEEEQKEGKYRWVIEVGEEIPF